MQTYFVKTAGANAWNVHTLVDGAVVAGPSAITFDTTGALATPAGGTIAIPAFTPAPGTAALNMTLDIAQTTQFGAPFGVNDLVQDGYTTGRLSGLDIDGEGVVFARYSNGQYEVQGQIALANFANVQGLQPIGNNTGSRRSTPATCSRVHPARRASASCRPARSRTRTSICPSSS